MPSPVAVAELRRLGNARLRREAEGQDLLEYALLFALIGLVALGAVTTVGYDNPYAVLADHCQQLLARRSRF